MGVLEGIESTKRFIVATTGCFILFSTHHNKSQAKNWILDKDLIFCDMSLQ